MGRLPNVAGPIPAVATPLDERMIEFLFDIIITIKWSLFFYCFIIMVLTVLVIPEVGFCYLYFFHILSRQQAATSKRQNTSSEQVLELCGWDWRSRQCKSIETHGITQQQRAFWIYPKNNKKSFVGQSLIASSCPFKTT